MNRTTTAVPPLKTANQFLFANRPGLTALHTATQPERATVANWDLPRSVASFEFVAELEGRKAYVLEAPIANPQIPLLSVFPEDSTLEAELYVPSRAVGFVNEGREASDNLAANA